MKINVNVKILYDKIWKNKHEYFYKIWFVNLQYHLNKPSISQFLHILVKPIWK